MLQDLFTFALQNGLPSKTLLSLLYIPALAALVIFFRTVIGLEYLQVHRGVLLAFGVTLLGFPYGIMIFVASVVLDFIIRLALERIRLLPPAKVSLSLFIESAVFLGLLIGLSYFSKEPLASLDVIPLILIIASVQDMLHVNPGDHPLKPLFWFLRMVIFLYGASLFITSDSIKTFILQAPLVFLGITLALIIFLGKFRGLRLIEFVRFFRVMRKEP